MDKEQNTGSMAHVLRRRHTNRRLAHV